MRSDIGRRWIVDELGERGAADELLVRPHRLLGLGAESPVGLTDEEAELVETALHHRHVVPGRAAAHRPVELGSRRHRRPCCRRGRRARRRCRGRWCRAGDRRRDGGCHGGRPVVASAAGEPDACADESDEGDEHRNAPPPTSASRRSSPQRTRRIDGRRLAVALHHVTRARNVRRRPLSPPASSRAPLPAPWWWRRTGAAPAPRSAGPPPLVVPEPHPSGRNSPCGVRAASIRPQLPLWCPSRRGRDGQLLGARDGFRVSGRARRPVGRRGSCDAGSARARRG